MSSRAVSSARRISSETTSGSGRSSRPQCLFDGWPKRQRRRQGHTMTVSQTTAMMTSWPYRIVRSASLRYKLFWTILNIPIEGNHIYLLLNLGFSFKSCSDIWFYVGKKGIDANVVLHQSSMLLQLESWRVSINAWQVRRHRLLSNFRITSSAKLSDDCII